MPLHIGFALYYGTALYKNPEKLGKVARLLLDERWPWVLQEGMFMAVPGKRPPAERKFIGANAVKDLLNQLGQPDCATTTLLSSMHHSSIPAAVRVDSGQYDAAWNGKFPFTADGRTQMTDLPSSKNVADWIGLVHELAQTVEAVNGIMCVWPSADEVLTDISLTIIQHNLPEPFNDQVRRAKRWRSEIGTNYVRHPRWGTYLDPVQAQSIGGLGKINSVVRPDSIVELGNVAFIQMTSLAEALLPVCEERRERFEDLLTPLLVPTLASD